MAVTIAANPTGLRKLAKVLTSKQLQQGIEIFNSALERKRLEDQLAAIDGQKNKVLEKLRGLDAAPAKSKRKPKRKATTKAAAKSKTASVKAKVATKKTAAKKKSARAKGKQPAKYQIEAGGKVIQWSGFGRQPSAIKSFLESGGSLDSLTIK